MTGKRKNKSITGRAKRLANRIQTADQRQNVFNNDLLETIQTVVQDEPSVLTMNSHTTLNSDTMGSSVPSECSLDVSTLPIHEAVDSTQNLNDTDFDMNHLSIALASPSIIKTKIARRGQSTVLIKEDYCGKMDQECPDCNAQFFLPEKTTRGTYLMCCHFGKVKLPPTLPFPTTLKNLLTKNHPLSNHFHDQIRTYNSALSFASFGASFAPPPSGSGPFTFRIHGQIYHSTSAMHPNENQTRKYAQLYILDSQTALEQRLNLPSNTKCKRYILEMLDAEIRSINPFAQAYKMLSEIETEIMNLHGPSAASNIRMYLTDTTPPKNQHKGRYNSPTANDVALIFVSADGEPPSNTAICIHPRGQKLVNISSLNPNVDPMSYVLFFPHGDKGFSIYDTFTQLQLYSYRIHYRKNEFNSVLYGGKLFQQFLVDCYAKVEGSRLQYIRNNQRTLRVESYLGLIDFVNSEASKAGVKAGNITILPSTFSCGPRAMTQQYHDAMAIVRKYGKPQYFCTITTNPKWREITENLLPGQTASDRADLVSRVFDMKKKAILKELNKDGILGKVVAFVYCIEYQKRGLPHCHLLIFLSGEDKINDAETIDLCVSAEIPSPDDDLELFNIIKKFMVHGPCGKNVDEDARCMVNGECSKGFPKPFCTHTVDNKNGYPIYKRPEYTEQKDKNRYYYMKNIKIDNRWIIPYNPYLTKKYNCHINLEICSSIQSVKYLFKYIYKGFDCANITFDSNNNGAIIWNEINSFLSARYLSAPEAAWRLLEKKMHEKSHTVIRLPVHLHHMQPVYFHDKCEEMAIDKAALRHTELTGWFALNVEDPDANQYLYTEIPYHYLFVNKRWQRRVMSADHIISRMHAVNPKDSERRYLRLLLLHVNGAKSFEHLRMYNDVTYESFEEACLARNLLQDDSEWFNALKEACVVQMPVQLRQLFVCICVFCNPTSALRLWNTFEQYFIEDYLLQYSPSESKRRALQHVQTLLQMHALKLTDFKLPEPANFDTLDILHEYDTEKEQAEGLRMTQMLNTEQKEIFDAVINSVVSSTPTQTLFSVNAFAGAGKSFLFNTILHAVRGKGKIAIPVAWTGIAATLLQGGRTACSTFKISIPVCETTTCRIKYDSDDRRRIEAAAIIIWDECTMTSKFALDAVDTYLRDLTDSEIPFGGKVVLLGGDWRQILPIAFHGGRKAIVESCLKYSNSWTKFRQYTLKTNMRTIQSQQDFAKWLIQLGDGTLNVNDENVPKDSIEIPTQCIITHSIIDEVFGNSINESNIQSMTHKAILCPANENALQLNEDVLDRIPGEPTSYYSADKIECEKGDEVLLYTMDFINAQTPSGMPAHHLRLKPGSIIMLLRNLNPSNGLCNGSRLIVRQLMKNIIDAEILLGDHKGKRVFIPRIQLSPSDTNLPFQLIRRQFPVRLSYAMTINKAQGQSLETVGLYLDRPVFSHGMLYVAFSRATSINSVRVFVNPTEKQGQLIPTKPQIFTQNVVFKEVFSM